MKLIKGLMVLAGLFVVTYGSVYLLIGRHAGTWEDSPDNWSRAFNGQFPPPGVQVHRSYYRRSPHFTYEASYFFELSAPDAFLESWVRQHGLQRVDSGPEAPRFRPSFPAWFAPDRPEAYYLWVPGNEPYPRFHLYQNRFTKRIFVCDSS